HDQRVNADQRHVDRKRTLRRKVERDRKSQEGHAAVQFACEPDLDEREHEPDREQYRGNDEVLAPVLVVLLSELHRPSLDDGAKHPEQANLQSAYKSRGAEQQSRRYGATGSVNEKQVSPLRPLATQMRPPSRSTMRLQIWRPSPVPCGRPPCGSPPWRK